MPGWAGSRSAAVPARGNQNHAVLPVSDKTVPSEKRRASATRLPSHAGTINGAVELKVAPPLDHSSLTSRSVMLADIAMRAQPHRRRQGVVRKLLRAGDPCEEEFQRCHVLRSRADGGRQLTREAAALGSSHRRATVAHHDAQALSGGWRRYTPQNPDRNQAVPVSLSESAQRWIAHGTSKRHKRCMRYGRVLNPAGL